jgi:hypothetical protein
VRWIGIIACATLAACGDDQAVQPDPVAIEVASYAAVPTNKFDVLFMIDNTTEIDMELSLAADIGPLLATLGALPGGLDLHLGVTSSDLGTSGSDDRDAPGITLGSCKGKGDDGALLVVSQMVTGSYLVDTADGSGRNYTGELAAAVKAMIPTGSSGCGFEQSIAATSRAFDNPQNAGFLREDANLLIVMLSDEDDCSVKNGSLFGPASDMLGSRQSYRCTRFGVVCDEPIDIPGEKTNCHSNETSDLLDPVAPYVEHIRSVKSDPARVGVFAMSGPPTPFAIELRTPPGSTAAPEPALADSCHFEEPFGPAVADPAVRLNEFARGFGANGGFGESCVADFAPRVQDMVTLVNRMEGVICLGATTRSCSVHVDTGASTPARDVPLCGAAGDDCFEIIADAAACPDSLDNARLVVHLANPTPDEYVRASCSAPN